MSSLITPTDNKYMRQEQSAHQTISTHKANSSLTKPQNQSIKIHNNNAFMKTSNEPLSSSNFLLDNMLTNDKQQKISPHNLLNFYEDGQPVEDQNDIINSDTQKSKPEFDNSNINFSSGAGVIGRLSPSQNSQCIENLYLPSVTPPTLNLNSANSPKIDQFFDSSMENFSSNFSRSNAALRQNNSDQYFTQNSLSNLPIENALLLDKRSSIVCNSSSLNSSNNFRYFNNVSCDNQSQQQKLNEKCKFEDSFYTQKNFDRTISHRENSLKPFLETSTLIKNETQKNVENFEAKPQYNLRSSVNIEENASASLKLPQKFDENRPQIQQNPPLMNRLKYSLAEKRAKKAKQARLSRLRKKQYIEDLERSVHELERRIELVKARRFQNYKLMKEESSNFSKNGDLSFEKNEENKFMQTHKLSLLQNSDFKVTTESNVDDSDLVLGCGLGWNVSSHEKIEGKASERIEFDGNFGTPSPRHFFRSPKEIDGFNEEKIRKLSSKFVTNPSDRLKQAEYYLDRVLECILPGVQVKFLLQLTNQVDENFYKKDGLWYNLLQEIGLSEEQIETATKRKHSFKVDRLRVDKIVKLASKVRNDVKDHLIEFSDLVNCMRNVLTQKQMVKLYLWTEDLSNRHILDSILEQNQGKWTNPCPL